MLTERLLKSIKHLAIATTLLAAFVAPAHADGLGGLSAIPYILAMFAVAAAIMLLGVAALVLNLLNLRPSVKQGEGKPIRFARFTSVTFIVLTTPVYIWFLFISEFHYLVYLFVLLYLAVIATLWLQWSIHRRRVYGFVVMLFLLLVFRTPDIISYTKYNIVDNNPLDSTVELAEQKDSHFIHLADGRIFRFTEARHWKDRKFDKDAKLQIKTYKGEGTQSKYSLYGIHTSQAYSSLKRFGPHPLVTIPFRTVNIEKNQAAYLGDIVLLEDDWRANNRTLLLSIMRECCNPEWAAELIQRGANPSEVNIGSRSLLHYLAENAAEYEDVDKMAAVLIQAGVPVDARDEWGYTPLLAGIKKIENSDYRKPHIAKRYKEIFTVLLESDADPNAVSKDKWTALYDAVTWRRYDLARLLVKYGAVPEQKYSGFGTAYDRAYKRYKDDQQTGKKKNRELELLVQELKKK